MSSATSSSSRRRRSLRLSILALRYLLGLEGLLVVTIPVGALFSLALVVSEAISNPFSGHDAVVSFIPISLGYGFVSLVAGVFVMELQSARPGKSLTLDLRSPEDRPFLFLAIAGLTIALLSSIYLAELLGAFG
ncbi:MAG: hypothetical protein F4Z51_05880 [Chloroflexi bacterium]|nr:hypothetical protein [Chloroflexota bacterium]MYD16260.1 hypothetical protein [Chloroflexota bacterium]MYJ01489.1 hypothetical protein [Chloroflexota bacterium]